MLLCIHQRHRGFFLVRLPQVKRFPALFYRLHSFPALFHRSQASHRHDAVPSYQLRVSRVLCKLNAFTTLLHCFSLSSDWLMAPLVAMVINCLICFGLVLSSGIGTLVQCRFDRIISFFSNRSVKSILKNAPKRRESEEDEQMMELDPLEPDDEGVPSILLSLKLYASLSLSLCSV